MEFYLAGHSRGRGRGKKAEKSQLGQYPEMATSAVAIEEQLKAHRLLKELNISSPAAGRASSVNRSVPERDASSTSSDAEKELIASPQVAVRTSSEGENAEEQCASSASSDAEIATSAVAFKEQLEAQRRLKELSIPPQTAVRAFSDDQSVVQQQAATSTSSDLARASVEPQFNSAISTPSAQKSQSVKKVIGQATQLLCNYYKVEKKPAWTIFQYHVKFEPDVDNTRQRRFYFDKHRDKMPGCLFDGQVLYSPTIFNQWEFVTETHCNDLIRIKVKLTTIVGAESHEVQVLNLVLRRAMEGMNLQLIGRNYFDPQAKINLDKFHIELWPGYKTSIRIHDHQIMLCAEVIHKVMRTETLLDIYHKHKNDKDFKKEVQGTVVLTDYNNKTYRIDDVDFRSTPCSTFSSNDEDISYIYYYDRRYNIQIREHNQPLLMCKSKDKSQRDQVIMLIPELCRPTGLTDEMRTNTRLMKEMGEHTRMVPKRRIQSLCSYNTRLMYQKRSREVLDSWNLLLDTQLLEIPGRILPSQTVYHDKMAYFCDSTVEWTKQLRRGMHVRVAMKNWAVIHLIKNRRETQTFVDLCIQAGKEMKMFIAKPAFYEMSDDAESVIDSSIRQAVMNDPQLILVVLQRAHESKYALIKCLTCVQHPVPSQVVTLPKLALKMERGPGVNPLSIASKVVIQMNAKLGGVPWLIKMPLNGLMAIGYDVCHSPKNQRNSFGGFVASLEMENSSQYFSMVHTLAKGQELSDKMTISMTRALEAYKRQNGTLPSKIVFYRDGLGEGQLSQVVDTELHQLLTTLDKEYKKEGYADACPMTFAVITKRLNTRLMFANANPPPGTVVDKMITLPECYDFYLVPQNVRLGTVSPTCYQVVHDDLQLSPDRFQLLAYKMCHLYFNWSGAVRVPAVCQYAHKLAFLAAESIKKTPSAGLSTKLYFL